jgi:hypothetical protein
MALSVFCDACGGGFEVEDTFAGQCLSCPDCGRTVRAPARRPPGERTCGLALASMTLALVGAFTLVGTAAAVAFGVLALVRIARGSGRVGGAGFAVFGIVLGLLFTALTGLAVVNGEVFDQVRQRLSGGEVAHGGPLEVVRPDEGFAVTRPSRAWGVASDEYARELNCEGDLLLVNPTKDACLAVGAREVGRQSLEQFREIFLDEYRNKPPAGADHDLDNLMRFTRFRLRESRRLPDAGDLEALEVRFDVRLAGQNLAYRARLVRPRRGGDVYTLVAWAHRRRLAELDPEITRTMDGFRLLGGGP